MWQPEVPGEYQGVPEVCLRSTLVSLRVAWVAEVVSASMCSLLSPREGSMGSLREQGYIRGCKPDLRETQQLATGSKCGQSVSPWLGGGSRLRWRSPSRWCLLYTEGGSCRLVSNRNYCRDRTASLGRSYCLERGLEAVGCKLDSERLFYSGGVEICKGIRLLAVLEAS